MESIKLKYHIGEDGILTVRVPDELKNQELEVMVIFQSVKSANLDSSEENVDTPEARGWNPGFFENVVGSWEGEPLERPPQRPYRLHEKLDFGEDEE